MKKITYNPISGKLDTIGIDGLVNLEIEYPDAIIENFIGLPGTFTSTVANGGAVSALQQLAYWDANDVVAATSTRYSRVGLASISITNAASSRAAYAFSTIVPRLNVDGVTSLGVNNSFNIYVEGAITTIPDAVNDPCYMGIGFSDNTTTYQIGGTTKAVQVRAPFSNETAFFKISIIESGVETVVNTTIPYENNTASMPKFARFYFDYDAVTGIMTITIKDFSSVFTTSLNLQTTYSGVLAGNHRFGAFLFRNGTTGTPIARNIYLDKVIYEFTKHYV